MNRAADAVMVMLCVNDPDNGAPTGRICQVDIQDVIHLEGPIDFDDEALIGGKERGDV